MITVNAEAKDISKQLEDNKHGEQKKIQHTKNSCHKEENTII